MLRMTMMITPMDEQPRPRRPAVTQRPLISTITLALLFFFGIRHLVTKLFSLQLLFVFLLITLHLLPHGRHHFNIRNSQNIEKREIEPLVSYRW